MSAPQTPNTKEKATAATTDLKDTLTLLCAALGPEVINMGVFKKMHALQPEGRTVSSWEHLFRPLKVKAKEMIKEKGGDDEVSAILMLFLRCKIADAEGVGVVSLLGWWVLSSFVASSGKRERCIDGC